ncbi:hypothetical protein ES703_64591 [subsurface metagenome]
MFPALFGSIFFAGTFMNTFFDSINFPKYFATNAVSSGCFKPFNKKYTIIPEINIKTKSKMVFKIV